jgi:hypothetical protein
MRGRAGWGILLLVGIFLLFEGSTLAAITFEGARAFRTGDEPDFVAVGDFNGDGRADLAVANFDSNNVSILLGNGDGTFRAQKTYWIGGRPQSVAVGDFNGDGRADLAVNNTGSSPDYNGTVSVLLGNGDGTFQTQKNYAVDDGPQSVAVGDFNGDGKTDLAVANYGSYPDYNGTVSVLLGNGDGTFQTQKNYAVGWPPSSIAVGDFNGDAKPDLAVANYGTDLYSLGNVLVLLGNGDGTFEVQREYAVGWQPYSVAVGDFNGDGKADLVVANNRSKNVSVRLGNGDGTFKARKNYAVGRKPQSVAVGDFNGDGKADLAVADTGSSPDYNGNVSVLLGNGDGTFQAQKNYAVGDFPHSVAVGDFNGDGKADLAVANYHNVSILLGNGDGTFQTQKNYAVGRTPSSIAVGDFNGDGKADLAVADTGPYPHVGGNVSVLPGNGDGTFTARNPSYFAGLAFWLAPGDFNGDGKLDLAVPDGNTVSIFINTTRPYPAAATTGAASD